MAKETETSGSKKPNYHFMRLPQGHINSAEIKRLVFHCGAEGYLIYMQLLDITISNTGFLEFRHVEDTIEAQIAFDLNITEEKARDIINFLEKLGLVERIKENPQEDDPGGLLFTEGAMYTTSETPGAARQRRYMERKRARESEQASQNDGQASQNDDNKNKSKNENSELEQEARIRPLASNEVNSYSLGENPAAACAGAAGAAPPPPASSPFLEKIRKLNGKKKTHRLTEAGLEAFAKETNEGAELWGKSIEPDGLPKALNGWAKKMSEKGKHPEFFDDGAGQNAAAPGGAGQDHAGPDGTSAAPDQGSGKQAAPDRAGSNQAGNSTSAETAAKEKALEKRIAELVKECRRIEAAPTERVDEVCTSYWANGRFVDDCSECQGAPSCESKFFGAMPARIRNNFSWLAAEIFGFSQIVFFIPLSRVPNKAKFIQYMSAHYEIEFPKTGTPLLDDPFRDISEALNNCVGVGSYELEEEFIDGLIEHYGNKPFYGIPEAIARHELNMPLPCEVKALEALKRYEDAMQKVGNADLLQYNEDTNGWDVQTETEPGGGFSGSNDEGYFVRGKALDEEILSFKPLASAMTFREISKEELIRALRAMLPGIYERGKSIADYSRAAWAQVIIPNIREIGEGAKKARIRKIAPEAPADTTKEGEPQK